MLTFVAYATGFVILLVLTQDAHIFPGAFFSKVKLLRWRKSRLPPYIESVFVEANGVELEVWRYDAKDKTDLDKYVGVIFHGNGAPVENFIFLQMWLGQLGMSTYSFDYRGFGRSSGWPTERGIYEDSDAVMDYIFKREQVDPSRLIIVGISVGSAPAARIAAKHQPKLLILSSAFTDLKSAARAQPIVGLLAPFIWHKFPTKAFVQELKATDLLLCRGMNDRIVPPEHSLQLMSAYRGTGRIRCCSSPEAGHNAAFFAAKEELGETLIDWLS